MYKLTKLISFAETADQAAHTALVAKMRTLARGDAVVRSLIEPTLPGVYNGGDLIAHFCFSDDTTRQCFDRSLQEVLRDETVRHVDSVTYAGQPGAITAPGLRGGVYRTLLLSVDRPVDQAVINRFEAEMSKMPHYIPAIRNWQLSRVSETSGARQWTHVWEQEYDSIEGLMGPYTMHPYHWGWIDRWYDPECPDWIVNTHLCHSFCIFEKRVI